MRISDFLNDFQNGKIDPMSEVPMQATELNDMLMEYIASIKMHRATLNENDALKTEIKRLESNLSTTRGKLEYAYQMEKIQRNSLEIANRKIQELEKYETFRYSRGEIFNVLR
jgi:5-bromo-4-chloroindolyl phosphate hydrolysis protein